MLVVDPVESKMRALRCSRIKCFKWCELKITRTENLYRIKRKEKARNAAAIWMAARNPLRRACLANEESDWFLVRV